ncbi:MAG: DNA-processing protein DprA [Patescibacteria group bacterium]|jgi:DNA processing protein
MPNDTKFWVAFSRIYSLGPQKFKLLYAHFPSMEAAWQASGAELKAAGLGQKDVEKILTERCKINPEAEWEDLTKKGIRVITIHHQEYPALLKEIHSAPALLYVKGKLPENFNLSLAVVGTRKTTAYGRQIAPEITGEISRAGLIIISGLALGIDALAHQAALDAGQKTVAVLGCGLDRIYPVTNRSLGEEIVKNDGALISEYPPGTEPLKQHFPARNRIISGLAKGVLVIEGGEDSGSLITARFALDQNREIFAVPGNISSQTASGPNNLIKMGAHVVTSARDILDVFDLRLAQLYEENKKVIGSTEEEKILLQFLSHEPLHIDELIKRSKLKTSIANSAITMMEMKGMIRHQGGAYYTLAS